MGVLFWLLVLLALVPVFGIGWAARGGADREYIEARARWIAENELPRLVVERPPVAALDAELIYAPSARLDRPEITR